MAANNLAYLLLEHGGDANLALSLAQTARRGMPKAGATADTLAWASYHVGAYDTARKLLEDASAGQPGNATYHYHLGMTYLKLNQGARGKAELEKALKLNPDGPTQRKFRTYSRRIKGTGRVRRPLKRIAVKGPARLRTKRPAANGQKIPK